jgi:hypothetical protein
MAVKSLGTLTLDLVAKIGGFTGPLDKAGRHSKKTSDNMVKHAKRIGVAFGALAAGAVTAFALIVNKQRALIDQQAKTAQILDTTSTSIANLSRAADRGGISLANVEAAGSKLNLAIGKALTGSKAQIAAFDRLGLSAQALFEIPLDERISKINQALRDNVRASERAAVAADIYGARNARAIFQLDPEGIAEAARQVKIFGLNLSDVDAAKVEMANDAMSTFGMLADGIAKQLTVELAPVLTAIGEEFLRTADAAGGLGNVVRDTTRDMVGALAAVLDVGSAVGRVFGIIANTIVGVYSTAVADINSLSAKVAGALSILPDVLGGAEFAAQSRRYQEVADRNVSIAEQAADKIKQLVEEPLAGTALEQFYDRAQKAGEAAAAAAVDARKAAKEGGAAFVDAEDAKKKAADRTAKAIADQIKALQFQAATLGMSSDAVTLLKLKLDGATESQLMMGKAALDTVSAFEAQKEAIDAMNKAQESTNLEAVSILDSLMTEEESVRQSYERRRQIILDNTLITGQAQADLLRKLEEKNNEDLLAINGTFWEKYLLAAEKSLGSFDELTASVIDNFSSKFGDAFEAMIFDAETLEGSIANMAESMARSVVNALGQMAAQWLAYQAVQLLVGKTTQQAGASALGSNASASAISAGINAFSSTAAIPIVGPAAAPAAMAAALAVTVPMAAAVQGLAMAGMAHDGIDSVPQTGTWLLEKGERVTTAETSAKLDATLAQIQAGMMAMNSRGGNERGGTQVNMTINTPDANSFRASRRQVGSAVRRGVS